ncbi:MAG: hypothetical protein GWN87_17220, partial [Desulfuromonadales bacterium]|nr:hypothetical protein [Desulfuromonadales bacterium]
MLQELLTGFSRGKALACGVAQAHDIDRTAAIHDQRAIGGYKDATCAIFIVNEAGLKDCKPARIDQRNEHALRWAPSISPLPPRTTATLVPSPEHLIDATLSVTMG